MKIRDLSFVGAALGWLLTAANPAFAQGTVFTYQGRLGDDNRSAQGTYDLRFAIWDSLTNGNAVAGPVTNAAVIVTNGLFTAALDFGIGVFDGAPRWLEIGVRTNGNPDFTALAPRQPLTAVPYAMMANAVSNLLGTVPLAQLPGAVLTNNQAGVVLHGSFNGDGVGLTNISAASLTPDLQSTLAGVATGATNMSIGRYSWKNAIDKISRGQHLTIYFTGSGLLSANGGLAGNLVGGYFGEGAGVIGMLQARWPVNGCFGSMDWAYGLFRGNLFYFDTSTFPNYAKMPGKDTNWWEAYIILTNSSGAMILNSPSVSPFPAGTAFEFDVIAGPDAGYANIVVRDYNGGNVTNRVQVTDINCNAATPQGRVIRWTNSTPISKYSGVYLQANDVTNYIPEVACGYICPGTSDGIIVQYIGGMPSTWWFVLTNVPTAIRAPIDRSWNPDIVVLQSVEAFEGGVNPNAFYSVLSYWSTNVPTATCVLCGTYPVADALVFPCEMIWRNWIQQLGYGYFDAYNVFGSYSNMVNMGLQTGDGTHANHAGMNLWAGYFYDWLGLDRQTTFPVFISGRSIITTNAPFAGAALRAGTNGVFYWGP